MFLYRTQVEKPIDTEAEPMLEENYQANNKLNENLVKMGLPQTKSNYMCYKSL